MGLIKKTTGLVGLAVAPNPHHTLGALYGKILRTLQKMPETSVYRKYTEQIVKERAAVLKQVKAVESSDTEDISDIEEDTIASNGEEDSGESTDEVSDQESDNAMIQERKEEVEKTNVYHEVEPTVVILNAIEEKSIEERKEESEPNNSSNPNNSEEKTKDTYEIETKINCGQAEELIIQAENELNLARKMLTWKAWEPLVAKPPKGQWDWPPTKA